MADNEEGTENTTRGNVEMADNEDGTENASRGNDWEVVSLTASAYAAAPSPDQPQLSDEEKSGLVNKGDTGTSDDMFKSRHFVFPPSQHENLPLEPKNVEIGREQEGVDAVHESYEELGGKPNTNNEEKLEINVSDVYSGIANLDEKGNILSVSDTELEGGAPLQGLNLVDKEKSFYDSTSFDSFQNESTLIEESAAITESTESIDQSLDSGISNMHADKDKYDEPSLPCEAWWKKQAASIYSQAKEANTIWSIFIAAAVMGIVILGQRWQLERWQILQLKGQFCFNDETLSRMLRPLSRIKGVFVGGDRRSSLIRGSSSTER